MNVYDAMDKLLEELGYTYDEFALLLYDGDEYEEFIKWLEEQDLPNGLKKVIADIVNFYFDVYDSAAIDDEYIHAVFLIDDRAIQTIEKSKRYLQIIEALIDYKQMPRDILERLDIKLPQEFWAALKEGNYDVARQILDEHPSS